MGSKSNLVESIKEAVSSASRAISENPEIEINFGGMGSSLPNPPSSYGELASFRGKADSLACIDRFRDKTIHVDAGTQRLNSLMQEMENVRVEVLGSKKYPGIASNINAKFEEAGLRIVAQKRIHMTKEQAGKFYEVHSERPFYDELCEFMSSEPVVVQVLEGVNAISKNREVMGATNPADAAVGTVRADFAESVGENSVHGSDAPETAAVEIAYFFSGIELVG